MPKKIHYESSDAWLLLAIIYARKNGEASIQAIIEAGDATNHAVFTSEEVEGGLSRLAAGGLVKKRTDGTLVPTPKVIKAYSQTTPRRDFHNELRDMERFLGL